MKNALSVRKVLFSLAVVLLAAAACGGEPSERVQKEESRLSASGDCEQVPAATLNANHPGPYCRGWQRSGPLSGSLQALQQHLHGGGGP